MDVPSSHPYVHLGLGNRLCISVVDATGEACATTKPTYPEAR